MSCSLIEIESEDPLSSTIFSQAYHDLFIPAFPDPDERETPQQILDKLCLRHHGYYGRNGYHVVVALVDGRPVGLGVIGYLAKSNCGVVEFIAVSAACRGQGVGSELQRHCEQVLAADAMEQTGRPLDWLLIEAHDPERVAPEEDVGDPRARIRFWERQGFRRLEVAYVQPPLDSKAAPVRKFLLMGKVLNPQWNGCVPGPVLATALKEYAYWGFDIESPGDNPYVREMLASILKPEEAGRPVQAAPSPGGRVRKPGRRAVPVCWPVAAASVRIRRWSPGGFPAGGWPAVGLSPPAWRVPSGKFPAMALGP